MLKMAFILIFSFFDIYMVFYSFYQIFVYQINDENLLMDLYVYLIFFNLFVLNLNLLMNLNIKILIY